MEDIAVEYEGQVKVGKLDVEANQRVAREYGIRKLPTLLFFKNGQVVNYMIGAFPRKELAPKFEAFLQTAIEAI